MKAFLNTVAGAALGTRGTRMLTGASALIAVMLLSACGSTPSARYYTLSAATPTVAPAVASSATPVFIELAPVAVPERLARPQMVLTKPGAQSAELELLEQHRWTSSFENEIRDALSAGITARAGAIDISKSGRNQGLAVWRIAVQLRQFDAIENSRVDASFGWTIRRSDDLRSAACLWSGSEAVGAGMDALAQGGQRITARAAQMIAHHLAALAKDPASACPR